MTELQRQKNETEEQFIWRLGRAKDSGELDMSWEEIADIVNIEFREDEDEYRNESAYRKPYQQAKRFYEAGVFKDLTTEKYIELLKAEKHELKKERQKFRDEKLEYNKWLREESRDEKIAEEIADAIKSLPQFDVKTPLVRDTYDLHRKGGVLLIADTHYGTEFCVRGLYGELLNEYSPEIFEKRMWDLLARTVAIVKKEGLSEICVFDLGDQIDGILRVSQLMKLRYGVIDSAVRYGRFITTWLNELTKHVAVRYQMVKDSNHNQLRMLGQPKNTFKDENISTVIKEKIMDTLKDNPNFTFIQNPTGYIWDRIAGNNILGIHGEVKNLERAMKDFSSLYKVDIDILIAGHKHHQASEAIGFAKDVVSAPSVIGVDDYSMSLRKASDPGATFIVLEEGKGKTVEYSIKLD